MISGRYPALGGAARACLATLLVTVAWPLAAGPAPDDLGRYAQRSLYKSAMRDIDAGRITEARRKVGELGDYPLIPYLEYQLLNRNLAGAAPSAVLGYRERYAQSPVGERLFRRWLVRLGRSQKWRTLVTHYEPDVGTETTCYYLRGLVSLGRRDEAYAQVPAIWRVGRSQPKACDPLFDGWRANGHLTQDLAWERLSAAIDANQRTLARYLLRFFNPPRTAWAQAYYDVHVRPDAVTNTRRFREDDTLTRSVIQHGLQRLADRDPEAAEQAWRSYQASHEFTAAEREAIATHIAIGLADAGEFPVKDAQRVGSAGRQAIADAAIANQRWEDAQYWLESLPVEERADPRTRYWLARASMETDQLDESARTDLAALASERTYYGFLAADLLGRQPRLNANDARLDVATSSQILRHRGMERSFELYAVGDEINARREWRHHFPTLQPAQQVLAIYHARHAGWLFQSIIAAVDAGLSDDLTIRFPVSYLASYQRAALETNLPAPFLLAITRQESAFWTAARSSANARGLMQLLPSTATLVARRINDSEPSATDLYNAETNIRLGSHHLARLMERYGNRRPLTAAGYNAGEHRVDRWIRDKSGLAMDVWIETIPFGETRNYVKNVLAYHQVYAQLLGGAAPVLTVAERRLP